MHESSSEAWQARYGEAKALDDAFAPFLRHRSVRAYTHDAIPESEIEALIASAQSASTSSNLQLWSVVSVQDPKRREAVTALCSNQHQVRTAPWFFCWILDVHRIRQAAQDVGEEAQGLDYGEFGLMAALDVALAAERFTVSAEARGYGICYIGALRNDPRAVAELLQLPKGCVGLFGMSLGVPDPNHPAVIKPRLKQEAIWFRENYPDRIDLQDYNARMSAFYEEQGMKGEVTWSMRSAKRLRGENLEGREVLLEFLRENGLFRR